MPTIIEEHDEASGFVTSGRITFTEGINSAGEPCLNSAHVSYVYGVPIEEIIRRKGGGSQKEPEPDSYEDDLPVDGEALELPEEDGDVLAFVRSNGSIFGDIIAPARLRSGELLFA